jgi:hypothetical protein
MPGMPWEKRVGGVTDLTLPEGGKRALSGDFDRTM